MHTGASPLVPLSSVPQGLPDLMKTTETKGTVTNNGNEVESEDGGQISGKKDVSTAPNTNASHKGAPPNSQNSSNLQSTNDTDDNCMADSLPSRQTDHTVLNFELKTNKALKNHQISSCSFCAVPQCKSGSTRLILSSVYFSPDSLQPIQEKIKELVKSLPNMSKDSAKMSESSTMIEVEGEPGFSVLQEVRKLMDGGELPRGRSLLIAADFKGPTKGATITYGHSLENAGEMVIQTQAAILLKNFSEGTGNWESVFVTCLSKSDGQTKSDSKVQMRLFNADQKKFKVISDLKNVELDFSRDYFQILEFSQKKQMLLVFQSSPNALKLVLANQTVSDLESPKGHNMELVGDYHKSNDVTLVDFQLDSQLTTEEVLVNGSPDDQENSTGSIPIVCLSTKADDQSGIWSNATIDLYTTKINLNDTADLKPEAPLTINIHSTDLYHTLESHDNKTRAKVEYCQPTKVRYCSKLKKIFLFGHGQFVSSVQPFVFLVVYDVSVPLSAAKTGKIESVFLKHVSAAPLQIQSEAADSKPCWMPPIPVKILIGENPALRAKANGLTVSFVFGLTNTSNLFACTVTPRELIEVTDLQACLDDIDKTKSFANVSSITWRQVGNSAPITLVTDRYTVMTLKLKSVDSSRKKT